MNIATHSFSLKAEVRWQSAQQLKIAAMSFDERKTFAATKEDLKQNTTEIPVVAMTGASDSENTDNGGCPTASAH